MAVLGLIPKGRGLNGYKVSATQLSVTGTGAVATGLGSVATGGAVASTANSSATTPWSLAAITSISGGTVNVVVVALTSVPAIAASAAPILVNVIAVGN